MMRASAVVAYACLLYMALLGLAVAETEPTAPDNDEATNGMATPKDDGGGGDADSGGGDAGGGDMEGGDSDSGADSSSNEVDDQGEYDEYYMLPLTRDDRKMECQEKLEIVNSLFMDNESGEFDQEDIDSVRRANGDGYPDNSLGYVWCSRFVGGIASAKDNIGSIEMTIAPYLPLEQLPMTVNDVDALAGNDLESQALKAVVDQYDPSQLQTWNDYTDTAKSTKEATYAWSGAASLEGQAPSLGAEGGQKPQKTSFTRVMFHPKNDDDKDVFMCACGIYTSDMSAETGKGIDDDAPGGGDSSTVDDTVSETDGGGGNGNEDDDGSDGGSDSGSDGSDDKSGVQRRLRSIMAPRKLLRVSGATGGGVGRRANSSQRRTKSKKHDAWKSSATKGAGR